LRDRAKPGASLPRGQQVAPRGFLVSQSRTKALIAELLQRAGSIAPAATTPAEASLVAATGENRAPQEMVLVPRRPTREMLKAAWADALGEDAIGVWNSMIEEWLSGQNRESIQGQRVFSSEFAKFEIPIHDDPSSLLNIFDFAPWNVNVIPVAGTSS
jgi:hypothetical protein